MTTNLPTPQLAPLVRQLTAAMPDIERRDRRYSGLQPLQYAADEVKGDLKNFNVNLCRLTINSVAERMRIKRIEATVNGLDVSEQARATWQRCNFDQWLQPTLVDALALGAAYLIVWPNEYGLPVITAESAKQIAVQRHPVTNEVTAAMKKWTATDGNGVTQSEHYVLYTAEVVTSWSRYNNGTWQQESNIPHGLGVVPVVPLINIERLGDLAGGSVIDDLGHLVDGLSKVLADVLVASEDTARPRRWATGVDLEEATADDNEGFTADGAAPAEESTPKPEAVSPFESGNRMFTVESPDAKFGQLEGANLQGYKTAVDLLIQQIMAVSALPAHMIGVTTSNPTSADATRAAEASLSARADSRINVLGMGLERAIALAVSIATGYHVSLVNVKLTWASTATRSIAQEADATVKLAGENIITVEEARDQLGYNYK